MLQTIALWVIFISAPAVFGLLFFVTAPYGRHFRGGWGPSISARAGWMIMEAPALLVIGITVIASGQRLGALTILVLGLWEIHYLYRTCVFPVLMRGSTKRFPLMLVAFAFIFNTLNGYANGTYLSMPGLVIADGFFSELRVGVGVALFAAGFVTHVMADRDLRHLRKPEETGYKIPRGGLWEYVSNPNYFGEIMEWCGWALAVWSVPALGFAVFTIANLVPRAWANRKWYQETFQDYPRERKSVIPFVF
jgi:protein-S-isoprenylcysteine O-methyltransferase Ste14